MQRSLTKEEREAVITAAGTLWAVVQCRLMGSSYLIDEVMPDIAKQWDSNLQYILTPDGFDAARKVWTRRVSKDPLNEASANMGTK
jgi:hypothetical protein